MSETWKDVVGFEGVYQVSSLGRVKSLKPGRHRHGRILKPQPGRRGYLQVRLYLDGKASHKSVHRLVLGAHVGPPPTPAHEGNHKNGDVTDNRVANLGWVTRSENGKHAYRELGREAPPAKGEANSHAKLTRQQVIEIRELWATGKHTQAELGEMFGVTQCTISKIVLRVTWQHVA